MTEPKEIRRYLRGIGEPTDAPQRSPSRSPPFWRAAPFAAALAAN
jgi:hypothetical protein